VKILIVAAHPDDEVLGMGGTILRHSKLKDIVKIVYLATGISSRQKYDDKIKSKKLSDINKNKIKNLQSDAKKAAKILKVKDMSFYDFPDNELDSIPLLKIVKVIENEIKKFKPDIVYTNHFGDLNIDHRVTYNATLTACRPVNNKIKKLISFEVPSSTEWNYPQSFNPNYFINIEKEVDSKINSFKMFKSEIRNFPHPRSSLNLKIIAQKWGSVSGFKFAEAFEIIRQVDN
jgi:LmbE family N-acetylglucosaminyl deacetylase